MKLYDLKTNNAVYPLAIDSKPYFSWKIESDLPDTFQKSYQLEIQEGEKLIWKSEQESTKTSFISYQGIPLKSRTRYDWRVCVKDEKGNEACEESYFETALFYSGDWKAVWSASPLKMGKRKKGFGNQPAPVMFRRSFTLPEGMVSARLYATCRGVYEASINGKKPDERLLAPEYTSYDRYHLYQVYDVSDLLKAGENVLGMYVSGGWYFSPATAISKKDLKKPYAVLYQIEVRLEDGSLVTIASDGSEKCSEGPIRFSDLFAGEHYDANMKQEGWDEPGFDDSAWKKAAAEGKYTVNLAAQTGEPVKAVKEVSAKNAYVSPKGEHIIDFGQNLAGHVRFHVHAPKGAVITLEHFEIPDQEGNYFNNILGAAGVGEGCDQKVVYVSDGNEDTYEAKFTFHGFRYVKVSGLDQINPEDFTAIAVSTAVKETGTFETSDERLNRLYANTRWSQRSNMISIPTDCPQREKAGWTGDIGIYAPTALQNEDVTGLLERWLKCVSNDQMKNGAVPMVIPFNQTYKSMNLLLMAAGGFKGSVGVAGWGDACILVPLAMYEQTGNTQILREQYESMKKWCDFIIYTAAKYRGDKKIPKETDRLLWNTGFHYGEWLIPSKNKNGMTDSKELGESINAGRKYIPETYAYLAMRNFAGIAGILGEKKDVKYYGDMAEKMKQAFIDYVITEDGKMPCDLMGAYVIPLYHGLVPEKLKESFTEEILKRIRENNGCLDTGFLGTPVILDTLCDSGHVKEAFDLLFNDQCPSWLYEVDHGATTIWESWITTESDGSPRAVSLNHYAFGCVDDWMFRRIGGITPTSPGYETFRIQPLMDERITSASRSFESSYGKISCSWKIEDGTFHMDVTVPPCTKAEIILPDGKTMQKGSGSYTFECKL